jgi:hypothetical protein
MGLFAEALFLSRSASKCSLLNNPMIESREAIVYLACDQRQRFPCG